MGSKQIIYLMPFSKLWADVVYQLKQEANWNPALFVTGHPLQLSDGGEVFVDVPIYELSSAFRGEWPCFLRHDKRLFIDEKLLNRFFKWESVTYEMMSRFLADKDEICYRDRRFYYWKLIRIWISIFNECQPDCIIAASMPHRIFDYVVYQLCELYQIPFITPDRTAIPHLSYVSTSAFNWGEIFHIDDDIDSTNDVKLQSETMALLERTRGPYGTGKPIHDSRRGLFSKFRQKEDRKFKRKILHFLPQRISIVLFFIRFFLKRTLFTKIETMFCSQSSNNKNDSLDAVTNFAYLRGYMKTITQMLKAKHFYESHISRFDKETPFVYFSANAKPERSTVPDAGYFNDYHLIFDILDKAIPEDWNIYYKEHPRTFFEPIDSNNPITQRVYQRLFRVCPRIKLLDSSIDPFCLIDNCRAVAVANGTVAWEAIVRGKPVFSFGTSWNNFAPGMYRIRSYFDCRKAVEHINTKYKPDERKLFQYLSNLEQKSVNLSFYFEDNVKVRGGHGNSEFDPPLKDNNYRKNISLFSKILTESFSQYKKREII